MDNTNLRRQSNASSDDYGIDFSVDAEESAKIEKLFNDFAERSKKLQESLLKAQPDNDNNSDNYGIFKLVPSQSSFPDTPDDTVLVNADDACANEADDPQWEVAEVGALLNTKLDGANTRDVEAWVVVEKEMESQVLRDPKIHTSREVQRRETSRKRKSTPEDGEQSMEHPQNQVAPIALDEKTPIERFRTRGRDGRPRLSVTDLLSNMWCEQQNHYTLLRGFKRRTAVMKAGTAFHREMEEEIFSVVEVDTVSREERWGLKIWNMMQGIDTLRRNGFTREFEVWGWIEGVWTIGIVDEIRFEEPDYKLAIPTDERSGESSAEDTKKAVVEKREDGKTENKDFEAPEDPPKKRRGRPPKKASSESLDADATVATPKKSQKSIDTFLNPNGKFFKSKPIYLIDLKTRQIKRPPNPESSQAQMAHLQLMLYHRLLSDLLISNPKATTDHLCSFNDLDAHAPFSDSFIAQIANMDDPTPPSTQDSIKSDAVPNLSLETLLQHNSLEKFYALFHMQLKSVVKGIHPRLTAVYRWQKTGDIIGVSPCDLEQGALDGQIRSVMSWWKGERPTHGVEVEEAWKCRSCDFNEDCVWRKTKINEFETGLWKKKRERAIEAAKEKMEEKMAEKTYEKSLRE